MITIITNLIFRSEEHTSELQSQSNLVCRLLLEKKNYDERRRSRCAPQSARRDPRQHPRRWPYGGHTQRPIRADVGQLSTRMRPVRLVVGDYMNARPLVDGLELRHGFALQFDPPSKCAALLHEGSIDVGMIPSFFFNDAATSEIYTLSLHDALPI